MGYALISWFWYAIDKWVFEEGSLFLKLSFQEHWFEVEGKIFRHSVVGLIQSDWWAVLVSWSGTELWKIPVRMRRGAANYRRPIRSRLSWWILALLLTFFFTCFLLFVVQHNHRDGNNLEQPVLVRLVWNRNFHDNYHGSQCFWFSFLFSWVHRVLRTIDVWCCILFMILCVKFLINNAVRQSDC